ncbi:MAG: UDP-N-acetylmuramoyl-L-alanine--D-glutamate ligase [Planctomycetota bacterium]|nr:MAG: UDP-N-acetylmuramoyl-L-alanine--D-glutamate ligase [Planctomycetota bacterium]
MGRTAGARTMPLPLPITEYRDLPVTVMGLGRFGGGLGAVKFLIDRGARVTVTDLRPQSQLAESLREFDARQLVRLQCGGHVEADFAEARLVVVNPAVKPDCPWLQHIREREIPRTSENNLFWHHNRGRVIGVTGSNGKSTTTALIAHLLRNAGRTVHLGGNIGGSLLSIVDTIQPTDWVVLELSSFQLADLNRIEASPEIAVVTNFAPNHLDWHSDLDDYRRAKQAILRWQAPSSTAVLNRDDPDVCRWTTLGRVWMFGHEASRADAASSQIVVTGTDLHIDDASVPTSTETISLSGQFPLPGEHNAMNVAAAICAVRAAGVNTEQITPALKTFQGLPHRLEHVATVDGRTFYNDSLATTPESAICALRAFPGRVLLLAGGYDKHVDLTTFASEAARRCFAIAWMGQTATQLRAMAAGVTESAPSQRITFSLREAFDWLWELSQPGDTILLSPACASFDWFLNFADRGEQFRECVHEKSRAIAESQPGPSHPTSPE